MCKKLFLVLFLAIVVENVYSKQCGECPKNCDYGFEKFKKGSTCSCVCSKNPCESKKCPEHAICQIKSSEKCNRTSDQPCSTSSAFCVSSQKYGECPQPSSLKNITQTSERCENDSDCLNESKCCSAGNHKICSKPCSKMMCKCMANTTLVYIYSSNGCPVCTCQDNKPGMVDQACSQEKVVGNCRARLPRYYFNSVTQKCKLFNYGGCGGNDNNFMSKQFCEKKCISLPDKFTNKTKTVDKCSQPKAIGNCFALIPKFFFNQATQKCEEFNYGGCGGNENNFNTIEECNKECSTDQKIVDTKTTKSKCFLESETGPCRAYFKHYFFNKTSQRCEEFVYGGCKGNENNFKTLEECQSDCKSLESSTPIKVPCTLARQPGPCRGYIERFYFDDKEKKCLPFVYGGCQGNENNFETQKSCESECISSAKITKIKETNQNDFCSLPKESGNCRAFLPKYFFNSANKQCESFIYGGCQGNENQFDTIEACAEKCISNSDNKLDITKNQEACFLEKDMGPCKALLERFYFDPKTNQCELFSYGGCGGNENNFETIEKCKNKCGSENEATEVVKAMTTILKLKSNA